MFLVKEITKSEQWILFKRKFGGKRVKDKGRVEISVTKFGNTNIFFFILPLSLLSQKTEGNKLFHSVVEKDRKRGDCDNVYDSFYRC